MMHRLLTIQAITHNNYKIDRIKYGCYYGLILYSEVSACLIFTGYKTKQG